MQRLLGAVMQQAYQHGAASSRRRVITSGVTINHFCCTMWFGLPVHTVLPGCVTCQDVRAAASRLRYYEGEDENG